MKKNTTFECSILSSNLIFEEWTQAEAVFLVVLALTKPVTNKSIGNNLYFGAASIFRKFIDNVELIGG